MRAIILPYQDKRPKIADDAFIAPNAVIIGDVEIGARSSVWYGCTVRGDVNCIRIGAGTNVQDHTVIHVSGKGNPTIIGDDILIGHMCVIHACTLEDGCFIGMHACVMDGVVVESGAMVAAGALVVPGRRIRRGELWGGAPAKHLRDLSPEEMADFPERAKGYANLAQRHRALATDD